MVSQLEKSLEELGDQVGESDKAAVQADLDALKEAIGRAPIDQATDDQIADIKAAKEKLMQSMQPIAQKVYEQENINNRTNETFNSVESVAKDLLELSNI